LADVLIADIAAAALAETAPHLTLERRDDLLGGEVELLQFRQHELDHDRRAAGDGGDALRLGRDVGERLRDQATIVIATVWTRFSALCHTHEDRALAGVAARRPIDL
jgi:hypothetical protein